MRQVISNVQNAFVDVQQAKEALKLAQDNLKSLEGIVTINEARLKSGDLAQVELDRSRLAALQYRASVHQAQFQLDQTKSQLQQYLGRTQKSDDFDITGPIRRESSNRTREEILQAALQQRPDLQMGKQVQARSQTDLRLQLANGKFDYTIGTEFTHQRAWGVGGNSVGIYFSVPLQIYNRNQGEIARAEREIKLGGSRVVALSATIQTEVEKAFRQYSVSQQLLATVENDMLAKARSVRDTTEYSYRRGEASLVEFLDAQRAFNDAMSTYNEARLNFARSLYLLDTVSGSTVSGS
jgi:cobalt-zinc-cadmium efflux system outer membrane protein